ncbi:hypothetical protein HZH68_008466 [Vespula germanica]|uniref:Uncharacterized protein n=1 Tax=Vespula germanica TaxID=30212 RepID=A0A834K2B4_VESGE|nr:hypothetical protein HZH68_008466 [Vespula germanica]
MRGRNTLFALTLLILRVIRVTTSMNDVDKSASVELGSFRHSVGTDDGALDPSGEFPQSRAEFLWERALRGCTLAPIPVGNNCGPVSSPSRVDHAGENQQAAVKENNPASRVPGEYAKRIERVGTGSFSRRWLLTWDPIGKQQDENLQQKRDTESIDMPWRRAHNGDGSATQATAL